MMGRSATNRSISRFPSMTRDRLSDKVGAASRLVAGVIAITMVCGCSALNLGRFKGIESTSKDENYYLVKNIWMTAGSTAHPRRDFDHTMQEAVNIVFIPANEKNNYVTKTVWIDPSGREFRTIRQTHELRQEQDKGIDRAKGGAQRVHSMLLSELYKHKPGPWKVELYIDDALARRLDFNVN